MHKTNRILRPPTHSPALRTHAHPWIRRLRVTWATRSSRKYGLLQRFSTPSLIFTRYFRSASRKKSGPSTTWAEAVDLEAALRTSTLCETQMVRAAQDKVAEQMEPGRAGPATSTRRAGTALTNWSSRRARNSIRPLRQSFLRKMSANISTYHR